MHSVTSALITGLALAAQTLAAVDCNNNILVRNGFDVRMIRDSCRVIKGDIIFESYFGSAVNLDGVEVIRGDILYKGCTDHEVDNDECPHGVKNDYSAWNLTSSTLRELVGGIHMSTPRHLTHIELPNLRMVNGSIILKEANELVNVDLEGLEYVGSMTLEAPKLESFLLDELKGFALEEDNATVPSFDLRNVGQVDSIDGVYKGPLDPAVNGPSGHDWESAVMNISASANIDTITLGWTRFPTLNLHSDRRLTTILGGPSTKSMHIDSLHISGDVNLYRDPLLQNLTVGKVNFDNTNSAHTPEITLPFDTVTSIEVYADRGQSIVLPPQAANWDGVKITILNPSMQLSSIYTNLGLQTWYWPKSLAVLVIEACISKEFMESFMEQHVVVTENFVIEDSSLKVDCDALQDYVDRTEGMAGEFHCWGARSSANSILVTWTLWASAMSVASWFLL